MNVGKKKRITTTNRYIQSKTESTLPPAGYKPYQSGYSSQSGLFTLSAPIALRRFSRGRLGYRLRRFGGTARIEVPQDQMDLFTPEAHDKLVLELEALGFIRMEIDPAGFRIGNLNRL